MANAEAGPSTPHEMRITNHGKITSWVTFALDHLQKYESKPLVLHTLPAAKGKAPAQSDQPAATEPATEAAPAGGERKGKPEGLHTSLATIPRLVTVVEIIKREYLKTLDPALAEAGSLSGLHQYNEIGDLEEAGYVERAGDEEQERIEALALALQGRNHAKQKKIAFMRVTLCRKEIPELVGRGATYQEPAVRKLSKSARARLKKKVRKEGAGDS
ncbi:uncharacterized protein TRAVEDRAFT_126495 [Trametes versicolor FP-101664 SS1]|uniref:uncharacterized protein n=1 Tax=Trametes versicolor (strain FP-101664) TaxID=717944 RepID=UPI0004621396|nr:uncharacterized protein TRAVEDRAFT_126495 [Trametes versicolor FP-101664 SS1]EIW57825.1 hypothetical protein TRAVEDRAFT_126495 [Trametes versicolor FP-101664 SS1]